MRFDRVRLEQHETPSVPVDLFILDADPQDRFVLKAIDGLGPPDVSLGMTDPLSGKKKLTGRKLEGREPVMRIGLNPLYLYGEAAADLRAELYQFFMPSAEPTYLTNPTEVRISFWDQQELVAFTLGYMKKFEIVPFNRDPEVQLTFETTTPYLEGPEPVIHSYSPPVANPKLDVKGNVPTGFEATVIAQQNTELIRLKVQPWDSEFTVFYNFTAGQSLIVNTIAGERSIELGDGTNLIGQLASTDDWISIQNGSTGLVADADDPGKSVLFSRVSYPVLYWGV